MDTRHDRRHPVRVDPAGDDVVEEEQGLGTHADEVVHAHGHEVDANGVVAPGRARHLQLRAHAVGRGHEDGVVVARRVERELASEPADACHHAPQSFDRGLARSDVDAGAGVAGSAALVGHGPQTPGSAAWYGPADTRSGRAKETGVGVTGTVVG